MKLLKPIPSKASAFEPIRSELQLRNSTATFSKSLETSVKQITRVKKISNWDVFECDNFKDYCATYLTHYKYDTLLAWATAGTTTLELDCWANVGKYSVCSMRLLHTLDPFRRKRVWHQLLKALPDLSTNPKVLTRETVKEVIDQLYPQNTDTESLTRVQQKRKLHHQNLCTALKSCTYDTPYHTQLAKVISTTLPASTVTKLIENLLQEKNHERT